MNNNICLLVCLTLKHLVLPVLTKHKACHTLLQKYLNYKKKVRIKHNYIIIMFISILQISEGTVQQD